MIDETVYRLCGDESHIVFTPEQVQDAIAAANTAIHFTNGIVDSEAEVSDTFSWPFLPTKTSLRVCPVYAPIPPCILHEAWGESRIWPSGEATIQGVSFPGSVKPGLEDAVAYLAAAFLLQDLQPETAEMYAAHAEELRIEYMMKKRRIVALGGPRDLERFYIP